MGPGGAPRRGVTPLTREELIARALEAMAPTPVNPARDPALQRWAWSLLSQARGCPPEAEGRFLSRENIIKEPIPPHEKRTPGMLYVAAKDEAHWSAIRRIGMYVLAWSPRQTWLPSDGHSAAHRRYAMSKAWAQRPCGMPGEGFRVQNPAEWHSLSLEQQETAWARFRRENAGWVCIWGDQGTGKSTIAWAAMMTAACYGMVAAWNVITKDTVNTVEYTGSPGQPPPWATLMHQLRNTPGLVMIDDLAYTQRAGLSDARAERWEDILGARVGLPTIITTNWDPFAPPGHPRALGEQLGGRAVGILREQCASRYDGDQRVFALVGASRRF